jgi:hypothetical protein
MRRVATPFFAVFAAIVIGACGSSTAADLFSGPSGGAPTPSSDSPKDPTDALGDAGVVDPGPSDSKDASVRDARAIADATVADTRPGYTDPGIFCGTDEHKARLYCEPSNEACCIQSAGGGDLEFTCKSSGASCAGVRAPCSDMSDCGGGDVCCATYENLPQAGYDSVECKATCGAASVTFTEYRLCDPDAPVDECAAVGKKCKASTAIDGWNICN